MRHLDVRRRVPRLEIALLVGLAFLLGQPIPSARAQGNKGEKATDTITVVLQPGTPPVRLTWGRVTSDGLSGVVYGPIKGDMRRKPRAFKPWQVISVRYGDSRVENFAPALATYENGAYAAATAKFQQFVNSLESGAYKVKKQDPLYGRVRFAARYYGGLACLKQARAKVTIGARALADIERTIPTNLFGNKLRRMRERMTEGSRLLSDAKAALQRAIDYVAGNLDKSDQRGIQAFDTAATTLRAAIDAATGYDELKQAVDDFRTVFIPALTRDNYVDASRLFGECFPKGDREWDWKKLVSKRKLPYLSFDILLGLGEAALGLATDLNSRRAAVRYLDGSNNTAINSPSVATLGSRQRGAGYLIYTCRGLMLIARDYERTGEYGRAGLAYEAMLKRVPASVRDKAILKFRTDALYRRGIAYARDGAFDKAIGHFRRMVAGFEQFAGSAKFSRDFSDRLQITAPQAAAYASGYYGLATIYQMRYNRDEDRGDRTKALEYYLRINAFFFTDRARRAQALRAAAHIYEEMANDPAVLKAPALRDGLPTPAEYYRSCAKRLRLELDEKFSDTQ